MDIREIARRAKVSTATVSRAINRVPTVDPQLAKRVWKVVDELGYYPNTQARALVLGRSRIFGLIVSEITNPFFPEIVQTFENLAVENNYEILLTSTVHDPKRMESSVRRMIERRVDGVAILTFGMEESLIEHLRDRKVPLVFVDVGPDVPGVANIRINYVNGIRQAVQHLAALRHTRIAFISGPQNLKSATARRDAFQISMGEIGLPSDLIVVGNHRMEGGMKAFHELHALSNPPTAVLCSNDMSAIGVMREAYEQDVKIPDDLSVVGFDDIHLTEFTIPPLTTVQMSQHELAKIAFQALLNEVDAARSEERHKYELTTTLVLRRSTALAPGGTILAGMPKTGRGSSRKPPASLAR
ncbi:MAG TPA: LacI family DNA-binding transcriptional regulator [Candidatus Acidoferrales bacterium]|nr:LacI family DNA-binding transcriptional regulator [Candidatus Acidoferrales bacterium]